MAVDAALVRRLLELEGKATPGPWVHAEDCDYNAKGEPIAWRDVRKADNMTSIIVSGSWHRRQECDLIAESRNALRPLLLALRDAAREVCASHDGYTRGLVERGPCKCVKCAPWRELAQVSDGGEDGG